MLRRSLLPLLVLSAGCPSATTPTPSPSPSPSPSGACATIAGPGTDHGAAIAADETWTAAGSPHRVTGEVLVRAGATLTVEACARVELAAGASVRVDGKLVSAGIAGRPVTFAAAVATAPWRALIARGGQLVLAHTELSGGGAPGADPEASATVVVSGSSARPAPAEPLLEVDTVTVRGSASAGVRLTDGAAFTASARGLTVTGSALHPLSVEPIALTSIPRDAALSGNGADVVEVPRKQLALSGVEVSVTMKKLGVPYRLGAAADPNPTFLLGNLGESTAATLTLEPGVEVRMRAGLRWDVVGPAAGLSGRLVAVGTAEAPILLRSAEDSPAAGDWVGIFLRGLPTAETQLDHVIIQHAGNTMTSVRGSSCGTPPAADSAQNMGALVVLSGTAPSQAFLTHSVIRDSASNGVDRAYRDDREVDFTATNTFERVAYCTQTAPRDAGNGCPNPVPCPRAP